MTSLPPGAEPPASLPTLDPAATLRPGRTDPTVVVVLGIVRRAFVPLVLIGLAAGIAVSGSVEATYDDAGAVAEGLVSPLAGLALALVSRVAVAVVGLVAAYPLSHRAPIAVDHHAPGRQGIVGRVTDRIHVTRALRELRVTRAVQAQALDQLGPQGVALDRLDGWVRRSTLPLVGVLVLVVVVRSL